MGRFPAGGKLQRALIYATRRRSDAFSSVWELDKHCWRAHECACSGSPRTACKTMHSWALMCGGTHLQWGLESGGGGKHVKLKSGFIDQVRKGWEAGGMGGGSQTRRINTGRTKWAHVFLPRALECVFCTRHLPTDWSSLSPPAGESINPRVAGLIGRNGPQNKQPFMVAFFKATEVHLRSIRSTSGGGKPRNPNRKGAKSQEALRVANVAGKRTMFNPIQAHKSNLKIRWFRLSQPENNQPRCVFHPETKHLVAAFASAKMWRDTAVCLCEVLKH